MSPGPAARSRGARPRLARPRLRAVRATTLDFDALVSGTAASAASFPGVTVDDALVLSEADIEFLLGFGAAGTFATSGDAGPREHARRRHHVRVRRAGALLRGRRARPAGPLGRPDDGRDPGVRRERPGRASTSRTSG